MPQLRDEGFERPRVPSGDDLVNLPPFLGNGKRVYAEDVIACLLDGADASTVIPSSP